MTLNKGVLVSKIQALLTQVSALTPEKCDVTMDPITGELIKMEARVETSNKMAYSIDIRKRD